MKTLSVLLEQRLLKQSCVFPRQVDGHGMDPRGGDVEDFSLGHQNSRTQPERGGVLFEYTILLGALCLLCMLPLTTLGTNVSDSFMTAGAAQCAGGTIRTGSDDTAVVFDPCAPNDSSGDDDCSFDQPINGDSCLPD
ncbi:MAG: hypothetical protein KDD43_15010 [Bdellovibrionales bacterium]|nr:hypothetical protein [Bdellovibrionales bacterium]